MLLYILKRFLHIIYYLYVCFGNLSSYICNTIKHIQVNYYVFIIDWLFPSPTSRSHSSIVLYYIQCFMFNVYVSTFYFLLYTFLFILSCLKESKKKVYCLKERRGVLFVLLLYFSCTFPSPFIYKSLNNFVQKSNNASCKIS